jgi:hypothetical protein
MSLSPLVKKHSNPRFTSFNSLIYTRVWHLSFKSLVGQSNVFLMYNRYITDVQKEKQSVVLKFLGITHHLYIWVTGLQWRTVEVNDRLRMRP